MNITAREQFGESQYLSKYSNQLVELMQPVALNANKQLYSAEYQALATEAQAMYESGEFNSLAEAQNYVNDAFQMYLNPYNAVSTGNTMQKWTAVNTIQNGGIDSPSAWLRNLRQNTETAYSWAGGDTLTGTIIESSLGGRSYRGININKADETNSLIEKYDNKSVEELERIYENQVDNADDFTTTTKRWNNWFENSTTWIGDIKNAMGKDAWGIATTVVKGIGAFLGGAFLIKLGGSAIGKAIAGTALATGGSSALSGAVAGGTTAAAGGGIAATLSSLASVAIPILSVLAVNWGVQQANRGTAEHAVYAGEQDVAGTEWENNATVKALMQSAEGITDRGGLQNGWNNMTSGIGYLTSKIFQGKGDNNKNLTQWIMSSDTFGTGSTAAGRIAVWGLMMDQAGYFDEFKKGMKESGLDFWGGSDVSAQDLVDLLVANGWTKADINSWASSIISAGWKPYYSDGSRMTTFDFNSSKYGLEGVEGFRYGLDYVPYDNYLANLHEGEAVLTSSTANELRNLLTEYRANNQSAINLDVAIQNQTIELVSKLDEVVTAIRTTSSVGGMMSTASSDQANAIQKLHYSMTHLISTKSALN